MSCECLIIKMKLFKRFIALAMSREKAEILGVNDVQSN